MTTKTMCACPECHVVQIDAKPILTVAMQGEELAAQGNAQMWCPVCKKLVVPDLAFEVNLQ